MSGDDDNDWKFLKEHRRERRRTLGVECPQCRVVRPKAHASILLPGQRCKVDGYRDPRPVETAESAD